jgi:hypothetical protein
MNGMKKENKNTCPSNTYEIVRYAVNESLAPQLFIWNQQLID